MKMDGTASLDRAAMARRGSGLEYFTIVWNSLEGVVALVTGWTAGRAFSAFRQNLRSLPMTDAPHDYQWYPLSL
jgi:hypothetical protein